MPALDCRAAGARFDLLHSITMNLAKLYPRRPYYIVNMGGQVQSIRQKATHAVIMPLDSASQVEMAVMTGTCRAVASEMIRLRCLDPKCRFRPRQADGAEMDDDDEDLNPDDKECEDDDFFEEDQDLDDEQQLESQLQDGRSPSKVQSGACLQKRKVFAFAHPESFYGRLLCAKPRCRVARSSCTVG